ncbi:MAG: hypothetical protein LBR45_04405 [Bacteroidales bacterium]|jgi:hypothetical protein|nr:hypothetical protein [Bacteroidales bacterium]
MNNSWLDRFIEALYQKYPQRSQLVDNLMSLLSLERESVYRRLRKDVTFPAEELIKIASAWDISLDEISKFNSKYLDFKLVFIDYLYPSNEDIEYMKNMVSFISDFKNHSNMEYMEISNRLPRSLTSRFPYLRRYQLLKRTHQYSEYEILPFSKIFVPEKMSTLVLEYITAVKNFKNTVYIWDPLILDDIIRDIQYFHSIYLVSDKEKELIKNDLCALLDYMSEVADKGCWPETSNKVDLYISNINIQTNYSYYYSDIFKVFRVHVFAKSEIYTYNPAFINRFRTWIHFTKAASTLISQADLKTKIEFFRKQYELVQTL